MNAQQVAQRRARVVLAAGPGCGVPGPQGSMSRQSNDVTSFLMCHQMMLLLLAVNDECWLSL